MELPETRVVLFEKYLGEELLTQLSIENEFYSIIFGYYIQKLILKQPSTHKKKEYSFFINYGKVLFYFSEDDSFLYVNYDFIWKKLEYQAKYTTILKAIKKQCEKLGIIGVIPTKLFYDRFHDLQDINKDLDYLYYELK